MEISLQVIRKGSSPLGWLTVDAVANRLGLSARRVRQLVHDGFLVGVIVSDCSKAWFARELYGRGDRRMLIEPGSVEREFRRRVARKRKVAENYAKRSLASRRWQQGQKARRLHSQGKIHEARLIVDRIRMGRI